MSWCLKCNIEITDDVEVCNECGGKLVDKQPKAFPSKKKVKSAPAPDKFSDDSEGYLLTVSSEQEASVIESLLSSHGIPLLKRYKNAGGFLTIYMGLTNFGIKLYVPISSLELAKDIISEKDSDFYSELGADGYDNTDELEYEKETPFAEYPEEETRSEDYYEQKRRRRARMLIFFLEFFPLILLALILVIFL